MNFNDINTNELDRDLSPEERAEWNSIYASYRAGSLLSGEISGIDSFYLDEKGVSMLAAVVIPYRVKILIPEKQLWDDYESVPKSVTRNLLGAKIDFVIQDINRLNNICTASRIAATAIRRREFFRKNPKAGERVKCNILAVGMSKVIVEICGFDLQLRWEELCYTPFLDYRLRYSAGQVLPAIIKKVSNRDNVLKVSVREAKPHPYEGLQKRHPVNSRRTSVITGKYKGSVFCKLEEDYDCLCNISDYHSDSEFEIGDRVIIVIREYDDITRRVYGLIMSKWR